MATADQVKALIRSHADGDDTRFYAIAMQVAAQVARSGHGKFAQELRDLVDQVKARAKAIEPARGPKPGPRARRYLSHWRAPPGRSRVRRAPGSWGENLLQDQRAARQ